MRAKIIDGKAYADDMADRITAAVPAFTEKTGRMPGLAVILVGSDPASEIYVRSKGRKTQELGMASFQPILSAETGQDELLGLIQELNADDKVDGILVQLPLPAHIDELAVIQAIDPNKDVDGLHPESAGRLVSGQPGLVRHNRCVGGRHRDGQRSDRRHQCIGRLGKSATSASRGGRNCGHCGSGSSDRCR